MFNKKIHSLLSFCLVVFIISSAFAQEKVFTLGGENGWPAFSVNDNITFGKGRFGYTSVELSRNQRKVSETTELLLNFENSTIQDSAHNYQIMHNDLIKVHDSVMGHYCGLSRGSGKGITLKGMPGTVFGTEGNPGTFVIEFWIKPSIAENGEIIFSWNSSRVVNNYVLYQMILATFVNSRIEWNFRNVFDGYTDNNGEISLVSYSTVVPDKWAHHILIFDEETGILEYKINGKTEDLKYVTTTNHEAGTIYQPVLGAPEAITICPSFTGAIDDLRILHRLPSDNLTNVSIANSKLVNENSTNKNSTSLNFTSLESIKTISSEKYDAYNLLGGRFETQPICTVPGAVVKKISTIQNTPTQTELRYYIRTGDNFYDWTDTTPEWKVVVPGQELENVTGRYFQLAVDFFPDGGGRTTPSISEIKISYYEPPLPLAPSKVKAIAGDGYVDLIWNYSLDETTDGYYVYYGMRPGEYLGTDSSNGSSPIKIGNVNSIRINGLKNGAIYYFCVAAFSKYDERIVGNFSYEVHARPSKNIK